MVVSRASHVHQIPQMMRPQIMPVASTMVAKASETSVTAAAKASYFKLRVARYIPLAPSATKNPMNPVKIEGTWKYTMR